MIPYINSFPQAALPDTIPGAALIYDSVRFPPENGEDRVSIAASADGESGMLSLASSNGSSNLVSAASPWMATAGALVVCFALEPLIYDGLNRQPMLIGSTTSSASTSARTFGLGYNTRSGQSAAKAHKLSWNARGESGASTSSSVDSAVIPTGMRRILAAVRFDNTNFVVDMWDCDTGTKVAGTPVAKPTGWAGIQNLTNLLGIGGINPAQFPKMASASGAQSINAWRGEIDFFAMLNTNPADAVFEAVALGADPWEAFGSANVRLGAKLAAGGAATFPVLSNRPAFASASLTKHGTLYPGSSIRRKGAASSAPTQYLTVDRLPDPCLCGMGRSETEARLDLGFKTGGVSGPIQMRVQDEDGTIIGADWRTVATASGSTASAVVSLPPSVTTSQVYRLSFRVSNGSGGYIYARCNSDVVVGRPQVPLGQSEMIRALNYEVTVTGNAGNVLGLTYTGDDDGKYVYRCDWGTDNNGTVRPVIYRSRWNYYLGGAGQIEMANRQREVTDEPLIYIAAAVPGTSGFAFINDADTSRKWSDFDTALSALGNRDASGRKIVNSITIMWEAFYGGADLVAQAMLPIIEGVQSVTQSGSYIAQADIDHYLRDGVTLNPDFAVVVQPANRVANLSTSNDFDDTSVAPLKRADVRANLATWIPDALVGPYCSVQAMEQGGVGDAVTHPDTSRVHGQFPWARKIADGLLMGMGTIDYETPQIASAVLAAANTQIVVTVTGADGDVLDTEGNHWAARYGNTPGAAIGQTVSGFEVQNGGSDAWSKSGFTATITGTRNITLVKSSGAWSAPPKMRFNPGGPAGYPNHYGAGNEATEEAWVEANPVFGGHELAGTTTDIVVTA